eukprot:10146689-Prorocentrum_lima.AAC.1
MRSSAYAAQNSAKLAGHAPGWPSGARHCTPSPRRRQRSRSGTSTSEITIANKAGELGQPCGNP